MRRIYRKQVQKPEFRGYEYTRRCRDGEEEGTLSVPGECTDDYIMKYTQFLYTGALVYLERSEVDNP